MAHEYVGEMQGTEVADPRSLAGRVAQGLFCLAVRPHDDVQSDKRVRGTSGKRTRYSAVLSVKGFLYQKFCMRRIICISSSVIALF